jgi:hypothetical protein
MSTHIIGCPGRSDSAPQGLSSRAASIVYSHPILADIDPYGAHPTFSLRCLKQRTDVPVHRGMETHEQERTTMTDAQVGLVMATPLIVIFAVMLHRMGVLRLSGTVAAVTMSVAIAVTLFLTQ